MDPASLASEFVEFVKSTESYEIGLAIDVIHDVTVRITGFFEPCEHETSRFSEFVRLAESVSFDQTSDGTPIITLVFGGE